MPVCKGFTKITHEHEMDDLGNTIIKEQGGEVEGCQVALGYRPLGLE